MPIAIQNKSLIQVSSGNDAICAKQINAPIIGTKGTHGV